MAEHVNVALYDWRWASYDLGVDGVDPITPEGVEVAKSKLSAVKKAANEQGVGLNVDD